jgi:hypothetical protein
VHVQSFVHVRVSLGHRRACDAAVRAAGPKQTCCNVDIHSVILVPKRVILCVKRLARATEVPGAAGAARLEGNAAFT